MKCRNDRSTGSLFSEETSEKKRWPYRKSERYEIDWTG